MPEPVRMQTTVVWEWYGSPDDDPHVEDLPELGTIVHTQTEQAG